MLQYIRARAQGLIAWIIVGFIALTFALWGVQEYLGGGKDVPVAKINDTAISSAQLQSAIAQQRQRLQEMLGPNFRPEMFAEAPMREAILQSLIEREVLVQAAVDGGLWVSDAQLASIIRAIPAFQGEDGQFSSAAYERALRLQGYTTQGFEAELRRDLLVSQLQSAVSTTDFAAPTEAQHYLRLQNQKRDYGYLLVPVSRFVGKVEVSEAEAQAYYEANQAQFTEPERVKVAYVELSVDTLARDVKVSEDEVQAYYDSHPEEFAAPEERRARHILFQVAADADQATVEAARKKAEDTLAQIRAGKDFAELARAQSEDPGSAKQGGDLGFFGRGVMDPAFEQAVFGLAKGAVSEPVRSSFGFHVIQLEDVRGGEVKPFTAVRDSIQTRLRQEQARQRFYEAADQLANLTYEHPDELQTVAEELHLPLQQSAYLSRERGEGLFANAKLRQAAFSDEVLEGGNNSDPVELTPDHLVVLRVADRQPASVRPLTEVRGQIDDYLRQEKARAAAAEAADRAEQALRSSKMDPTAYAKKNGYEWRRQETMRNDTKAPAAVVQLAFRMPRPQDDSSVERTALPSNDLAVVVLFQVKEGEVPADAKAPQLERANAEALYQGVVETLRAQSKIRVNRDKL
ncbi:MAG: SurA N-terminal domain-containing protein [Gammaproteobacteria bacterium]|nr:SurA N-terminal domain-containing protein [Gammaproteobacteria bacterium]